MWWFNTSLLQNHGVKTGILFILKSEIFPTQYNYKGSIFGWVLLLNTSEFSEKYFEKSCGGVLSVEESCSDWGISQKYYSENKDIKQ